jgi:dTDP-L-rhamnose 4-epimerase
MSADGQKTPEDNPGAGGIMAENVLITGGAGFIGSHLADELLAAGYRVRVLDNLAAQVHGPGKKRPSYLADDVELLAGDIRDPVAMAKSLKGIDAVFHFAASVGVGQSMYQVRHYVANNNLGTASLLQQLIENPVERLIVASSMSIYGEGLYRDGEGKLVEKAEREVRGFRDRIWEIHDRNGRLLSPIPTPEWKPPALASVYALSKYDQERLCLLLGQAYSIPTVALRFFNVYGPRQALSNPYTGVLAIFAARLLNGRAPMIFEDGNQKRDFIHVRDVAQACRRVLEVPGIAGQVFNIGSGNSYTINYLAGKLAAILGREDLSPEVTGRYRVGDIRHCFADIGLARTLLGFEPGVSLDSGLRELADWLAGQIAVDHCDRASHELSHRGLTV